MSFGRSRPDDWPTAHDRARAALSDQMDGALAEAEAGWLDTHLADCPECRGIADEYAAQRFELRALRERQPLPPRDLWARTAAAIELEASGRPAAGRGASRRLLLAPTAFIATALVVAVASGLLTSSRLPVGNGGGGSSVGVAVASTSTASVPELALGPTPIPIPKKHVDFVAPDAQGNLKVNVKTVDEVCPKGSTDPCDTNAPVEERSVTIDQDAQAVIGSPDQKRLIVVSPASSDNPGTVAVVTLTDEPVVPSSSPSSSPSASPATDSPVPPTETPGATPSPSTGPSSAPPTESPSPSVRESPTGSIDVTPPSTGTTITIAHGVELVGQAASYSESGAWFAFSARPIDGSSGPDVYVWHVGTPEARKVTDDGRSMFGSWSNDALIGSAATDMTTGNGKGTASLQPVAFVLDPASGARVALPQLGSVWRPAVAPGDHHWAVYWSGSLRAVDGPAFAPESGKLVLGDWTGAEPAPSGSPEATPLTGDQAKERHETTIGAGRVDDWTAAWDPTGTRLAVWVADHQNPGIGRLSLYAVRPFDGTIDLKAPLLESRIALAGFSISDGELIWAEPSSDGSAGKGSLQLLAWTADGVGTVETYDGPAIVIR